MTACMYSAVESELVVHIARLSNSSSIILQVSYC